MISTSGSQSEGLLTVPADGPDGAVDPLLLAQRLDDLQRQMDEVNRSIVQYLEEKRARRRRQLAGGDWPRFRRQARRLAHYAPS